MLFTPRLFYNVVFQTRALQLVKGTPTTQSVVDWKEGELNSLAQFIPLFMATLKTDDGVNLKYAFWHLK